MKNGSRLTVFLGCALGAGSLLGCLSGVETSADDPTEQVRAALTGVGDPCSIVTTTATASANAKQPASRAVDRNTLTRWESDWKDDQTLTVDLQRSTPLTGVTLSWETACGKDYDLDTADNAGGPWTNRTHVRGESKGGQVVTHAFNATARYVRMHGLTRCTPYGFSLWEFFANSTAKVCKTDSDGDGFIGDRLLCGACPAVPPNQGADCNDNSKDTHPGQASFFWYGAPITEGDATGYDFNCNGVTEIQSTSGASVVCIDSMGAKPSDCSACQYSFVSLDRTDCGHDRCSLQGVEHITCR